MQLILLISAAQLCMTKRRREQTADADEEQSNMSRRMSETDSSCQLQFMRTASDPPPLRSSYTLNSSFTQETTLSNDALALGLLQGMLPNGWDCSQDNTNNIQCGK